MLIGGNAVTESDPLHVEAGAIGSGTDIVPVTKHDVTADPAGPFRAIIIGGEGVIKLTTEAGEDRTLPTGILAAQTVYQIRFTRVWSSTTTATDIHGIV